MPARKNIRKGALVQAELKLLDKLIDRARERGVERQDVLSDEEEAEARAEVAMENWERRHGFELGEAELATIERVRELIGRLQPAPTLGDLVALREELQAGI